MSAEKNLNILIADDEEGLRFSLASILEIEGYRVKTAGDGLEALELVKSNSFDIAFFDIRMPGMNGVEVFKRIKEISPETIVVMMTAYAMNDLIKEAVKEGAFACISKPFEIEDVLNTVKEISSKKTGLVISEQGQTRDLLSNNLKTAGFMVVCKDSFSDAQDFMDRRKPDCIFVIGPQREDISAIKTFAGKLTESEFVIIASPECGGFAGLKNIKCVKKPLTGEILSEFFPASRKKRVIIISSDTIWANNLKLAVIAKGYDSAYYSSVESFFGEADPGKFDFVICDAGEVRDIDAFYGKISRMNAQAKNIFVFDFESSAGESLKKFNASFLQKPFDTGELLAIMERT